MTESDDVKEYSPEDEAMKRLGIARILKKSLMSPLELFFTNMPDVLGYVLRRTYYSRKLKHMGKKVLIDVGVIISSPESVTIGDYTWIDRHVIIEGLKGVAIGRRVHVAHNCLIQGGGFVRIGDYVGIAANSAIFSATDTIYGGKRVGPMIPARYRNPVLQKPVIIEKDAFIGAGSVILPGVTIGEGAVLGACSLVVKDIPPWKVAVGCPAKPIKDRPKITAPDI